MGQVDDNYQPKGHIGEPCEKCGIPVFTPGPDVAGTGAHYVRCCCEDGIGKA